MALNKCKVCGSVRSVMRVDETGRRVCAGKAERQCAAKRGMMPRARYRGGVRVRATRVKASG